MTACVPGEEPINDNAAPITLDDLAEQSGIPEDVLLRRLAGILADRGLTPEDFA